MFNHQVPPFDNADVRWALALLIDIKAVSMASYRGAATISALGVPPTGTLRRITSTRSKNGSPSSRSTPARESTSPMIRPWASKIADMLRPSMGEQIPTDPKEIAKAIGRGWWKPNPEAATQLLERAGFTDAGRQGG